MRVFDKNDDRLSMNSPLWSAATRRRFSIKQCLLCLVATCLLSTQLVIVVAQSENQRIYTGDELLRSEPKEDSNQDTRRFVFEHGAIIRGDKNNHQLSLVFTGDEFADGAQTIIRVLKRHEVKASFFFTGRFYRNPAFKSSIKTLRQDGHYLGAHSNDHLLYCDWKRREDLLVTKETFVTDLNKNYEAMSEFGVTKREARFFLPPFEWYNKTISDWTGEMGLQLINFTSGTRSNADYTTPGTKNYIASDLIVQRIKDYELNDPAGLNGFILLMHIGVAPERTDKFYDRLDSLIHWLKAQRYELVRIDQLLNGTKK